MYVCVYVCVCWCVGVICDLCALQALQALFQPLQGGHSLIKDAVVPYSVEEVCCVLSVAIGYPCLSHRLRLLLGIP